MRFALFAALLLVIGSRLEAQVFTDLSEYQAAREALRLEYYQASLSGDHAHKRVVLDKFLALQYVGPEVEGVDPGFPSLDEVDLGEPDDLGPGPGAGVKVPALATKYSVAVKKDIPIVKDKKLKYVSIDGQVSVQFQGSFVPADESTDLSIAWANGLQAQVEWKITPEVTGGGKSASGWRVKDVTPALTADVPWSEEEKDTIVKVSGSITIAFENGAFIQATLSAVSFKWVDGELQLAGPQVDLVPIGYQAEKSIPITDPSGIVAGTITVSPTATIKPNWAEIGQLVAKRLALKAGEAALEDAGVALTGVGLADLAAVAAPVAFAVVSVQAILELDETLSELHDLASQRPVREATEAFKAGMRAALLGQALPAQDAFTKQGFEAGRNLASAALDQFLGKAAVQEWIGDALEAGMDEEWILAEVDRVFQMRLDQAAPSVVDKAGKAVFASLKEQMFHAFCDEHGDDEMLCIPVFRGLYGYGPLENLPASVRERVKKWKLLVQPPAPAPPAPKPSKPGPIDIQLDELAWIRSWLWGQTGLDAMMPFEVENAYRAATGKDLTVPDSEVARVIREVADAKANPFGDD